MLLKLEVIWWLKLCWISMRFWFKFSWMCALIYITCIYIDASSTNIAYKHVHIMAVNDTKIFCWQNLKKNKINFYKNVLFFMVCIMITTYQEKIQSMAPQPKLFLTLWWCDILIHNLFNFTKNLNWNSYKTHNSFLC